jgi:hypothetical protein
LLQFKVKMRFQILSEKKDYCSEETHLAAEAFEKNCLGLSRFIHHDKLFDNEDQFVVDGKFTIAFQVNKN